MLRAVLSAGNGTDQIPLFFLAKQVYNRKSDFLEKKEVVETNNNNLNNDKFKNEQLNKINENIFILERNIPELTREYKNLLNKLNSNLYSEQKENIEINVNALEAYIKESKAARS